MAYAYSTVYINHTYIAFSSSPSTRAVSKALFIIGTKPHFVILRILIFDTTPAITYVIVVVIRFSRRRKPYPYIAWIHLRISASRSLFRDYLVRIAQTNKYYIRLKCQITNRIEDGWIWDAYVHTLYGTIFSIHFRICHCYCCCVYLPIFRYDEQYRFRIDSICFRLFFCVCVRVYTFYLYRLISFLFA